MELNTLHGFQEIVDDLRAEIRDLNRRVQSKDDLLFNAWLVRGIAVRHLSAEVQRFTGLWAIRAELELRTWPGRHAWRVDTALDCWCDLDDTGYLLRTCFGCALAEVAPRFDR